MEELEIKFIPYKAIGRNHHYCKVQFKYGNNIIVSTYNYDSKKTTVTGYGTIFGGRKYNPFTAFDGIPCIYKHKDQKFEFTRGIFVGIMNAVNTLLHHKNWKKFKELPEINYGRGFEFKDYIISCINAIDFANSSKKESDTQKEEEKVEETGTKKFVLFDDTGLSELVAGNFYNVIEGFEKYITILNDNGERRTLNLNRGKIVFVA